MMEPSVSGSDSDCAETYCNACNCDHEMDHTQQNVGSRIMMLKLKKARLETQVAYTRTRLLLAEMELQLAERELQHEVKNTSPATTPGRPQRKRPHKLVKLLSRVFKPSNQNTEEHTEVKDAKKRKNVEETEKRNKIKKSTDEAQDNENRNTSRINTQENRSEIIDLSKKSRKDKSKNTSDKKKKTETKINEKKLTEKTKGDKKHKISKDSKTKHAQRHKQEKSKEKDNNNGKVTPKKLKSILKKTSITEETNNNVPENISTDVRGINEDTVEFNSRTISFSPGHSSNSYSIEMETTNVDKALDTIAEIDENIFIKKELTEHTFKKIVEVVDAIVDSQNDQLFKELRGNYERQNASSLGSMETLVLDEESEDRIF